jgi:predicted GH43/DUF377 family glycosyl hydrolase
VITHAAVPFAECVKGEIYRVYFAGRNKDNRSQIGYFEIDIKNPTNILYLSEAPILEIGEVGTFDDSGVMPSWIVNFQKRKYLYYIGWNQGVRVPFYSCIGLAISNDGKTFRRYTKAPILERNVIDPYLMASPCVMIENKIWKMWYLSGLGWIAKDGKPEPCYHIKYAESEDGIHWIRKGIVCIDFKSKEEHAIARPCVVKEGGLYKMWYSYRGEGYGYRIGYAESEDGINWERKDEEAGIDVSEKGWDSEMVCYAFVFNHRGKKYMLYNGNDYGRTGIGLAVLDE